MGAEVNWDEETNTATVTQNDQTITFQMDNTAATVNGEVKEMGRSGTNDKRQNYDTAPLFIRKSRLSSRLG